MRTGGCTVQQALTPEAASVVKQAVSLAKRRGHAQVTPLHVANTMFASSTGHLRTACLQSQSHPLQCRALELCFNVALNRLPASNSSPMLGASPHTSHQHYPSISNALVAAFKRAQAHQRRGSIENQQQPLLAVKIELEQLIISILDDPSVSRVMREAGFSSTQVKSNVEQAVSLEICSQTQSQTKSKEISNPNNTGGNNKPSSVSSDHVRIEDVKVVIDSLLKQRKTNTVILGESVSSLEGVVRGVKEKFEKGEEDGTDHVDQECLRDVEFVSFSLSSFGNLSRVEVEGKIGDLKSMVAKKTCLGKGVVLYIGDLKWVFEYRDHKVHSSQLQGRGTYNYCPVEHMIMEIAKLVCEINNSKGRFWMIGIATFQTYMRCKKGHPSLDTVWSLHPLTIPAGSLSLSLITESDQESQSTNKKADQNGTTACCGEPGSTKFETQGRILMRNTSFNSDSTTTSSQLPAWLQKYINDQNNKGVTTTANDQDCVPISDLCRKWNSICSSVQEQQCPNISERTLTLSSVSPSSSHSGFSYDHHFWKTSEQNITIKPNNGAPITNLRMFIPDQPPFSISPLNHSDPNSTSSSDVMETDQCISRFKEFNSDNFKTLCDALEKNVHWQKPIIPDIVRTILKCRSGMSRRKGNVTPNSSSTTDQNQHQTKEETWLLFQGMDMEAKDKIARELAKLVFGSNNNLVSISLSRFSSNRSDSTEDSRNKRSRDEQSCSYIERFAEAVYFNPHRVFLVEDLEQSDYFSQMGFKRAMERGRIVNSNGEEVGLGDAIVILSCESLSSRSRACSPTVLKAKTLTSEEEKEHRLEETSPTVSLDLNMSFESNTEEGDDQSLHDIGLVESVDGRVVFKIQEYL